MKIHLCKFQYPIQQQYTYTSNRQKIPISLVQNSTIFLFAFTSIPSIVTTEESYRRAIFIANLITLRESCPGIEIPLVLLIRRNFAGATIFSRCKKKKKKKRSRARSCRVLLKSCIFFEREDDDARAVVRSRL